MRDTKTDLRPQVLKARTPRWAVSTDRAHKTLPGGPCSRMSGTSKRCSTRRGFGGFGLGWGNLPAVEAETTFHVAMLVWMLGWSERPR